MDAFGGSLALFAVAVVAALAGVVAARPALFAVAKPVATLSLLAVVAPDAGDGTDLLFAAGLILSAAGDLALLSAAMGAFMAGLVLFLLAHLTYAAAFLTGGGVGAPATLVVGLLAFGLPSGYLVRVLLPAAGERLRLPVVVYAAGITFMSATALATMGGPWPAAAAVSAAAGAALFYCSDANLAWTRFLRPYRHAQAVTLALYWAGQLGLALAARWRA